MITPTPLIADGFFPELLAITIHAHPSPALPGAGGEKKGTGLRNAALYIQEEETPLPLHN